MSHLRRRDWAVVKIPHREASWFVRHNHYAKTVPNTGTYIHGLFRAEDTQLALLGPLHGVALWIPPTKAAAVTVAGSVDWGTVLALSRFAVDPECPTNTASYLLGRSMRMVDRRRWPWLLTYADTRLGHTGAIYRATNWTCLGEVPAGDVWVDAAGRQRGRKRGGRTLTAEQMRALGYRRVKQLPKIKFVHHVKVRQPRSVERAA